MTKIFYKELLNEKAVFKAAFSQNLPLLLKGPTGCGKSRFVEAMAQEYDKEVVTVSCNDETSATDLIGRYLIQGGNTVWQDGPVLRAVKNGSILYLDEIAEAREDVITVLHALTDHRREIFVDRLDKSFKASDEFMMIVSFNPGYQQSLKEMKPSTRQRFISIAFNYPDTICEQEIVQKESNIDEKIAKKLVQVGSKIRNLHELGLTETVSTRLLISAAKLIKADMSPRTACNVAIVQTLTDDLETTASLQDIVNLII
jgi:nitric oxide reductase NorQ protein